ncbi:tetratricopeptide repeat protein [Chelativorans sp. M5D2P16]|uniref:tetratricopeptide repeat protein n=1 Tax=Chelativorans sp. M5D2P16 TaxID=3095678 RepID=UPI002ACA5B7D|nr:tetratricopeptide repeat protein [Chelativorans sp. M5D2P16]MDZ5699192.1 tetratricopeptide repeat protein [Chelativorans sp. M5D2P16]
MKPKQFPPFRLVVFALAAVVAWSAAPAQGVDGTESGAEERQEAPFELKRPTLENVDPRRFGKREDAAFGAFQRGYYLTALKLARPRAEAGDPAAQTLMAEIYARGLGVAKDVEKAAELYAEAAKQGIPEAQMQYALILIDGSLVEKDPEQALTLMRSAAEAGEPLAQFNLAQMMMESGSSVDEAVRWYERAASARLPDAQYAMAQIHTHGVGHKQQDEAEALRWLRKAARQNYDTAQLDLGTWLVEGRGGKADPKKGFAWLKRAAESGNIAAQNRVAKLYRAGIGVEADSVLAAAWYILARRAGLEDPEMKGFMAGLTDEELKEAVERANRLR